MAQERDKERKTSRRTQEGFTESDLQSSGTGASGLQQAGAELTGGSAGTSTTGLGSSTGLGSPGEESRGLQSGGGRTADDVTLAGGSQGNLGGQELTGSQGGRSGSFFSRASQRISHQQERLRSQGGFSGAGALGGSFGSRSGYTSESNVADRESGGYQSGGREGIGSRGYEGRGGPEGRGRFQDDVRAGGGGESWRPQDADRGRSFGDQFGRQEQRGREEGAQYGGGTYGGQSGQEGRGSEGGGFGGGTQGGRTGYGDADRSARTELGYGTGQTNEEAYRGRQHFESERFGGSQGGFDREAFGGTTAYGAAGYGLAHQGTQQFGRGEQQTGRRSRWQREALTAREIMTKNPKTVTRQSSVRDIAQIMRDENTGVVPVVDEGGRLQGIVTDRDIVMRTLAEGRNPIEHSAADVMTEDVEAVTPDEEVKDIINLMGERQIRRVPVVDQNDRLVGIISMGDIATRVDYDEELQDALEQISSRRSFWSRLFA